MRNASLALSSAIVFAALLLSRSDAAPRAQLHTAGSQVHPMMHSMFVDPSGRAPQNNQDRHFRPVMPQFLVNLGVHNLAVSDGAYNAEEIFNTYGHETQFITNRLNCPDGSWYDNAGDLYVTNYCSGVVAEYDPGQKGAAFTYTTGLGDPINITTDAQRNVYVSDYTTGHIVEYAHRSNTIMHECSPGGYPQSMAVDRQGDVFVSQVFASPSLAEYAGGLSGCVKTSLAPSLGFAGQLLLDNQGNLVASDQLGGVDIIPPPYTTIKATIYGFAGPFHLALSPRNELLFFLNNNLTLEVRTYTGGVYLEELCCPPYEPVGVAAD